MGDQIYPAIQLDGIERKLTEKQITDRLMGYIREGGYEACVSSSGLKLEVLDAVSNSKNGIISGLNIPFNKIRVLFAGRMLGNNVIKLRDVDYGIQRSQRGFIDHYADNDLHRQLKEGNGFLEDHLKIFTPGFVKKVLGGSDNIELILVIQQHKDDLNLKMLDPKLKGEGRFPGFLHYRYNPKLDHKHHGTVLEFVSRLDAIQALAYLNGNKDFCKSGVKFNTAGPCSSKSGIGLGKEKELVNFQKIFDELKYVPFSSCHDRLFDFDKIRNWKSTCMFCLKDYVILGVDPDLNWLAGTCGCDPLTASYAWPGEAFFRLTTRSNYARRYDEYKGTARGVNDCLMLLLKGIQPLASSVESFQRSVFATEKVDFRTQARTLATNFQLARVASVPIFVEEKDESDDDDEEIKKSKVRFNIEMSTLTSELWSKEGFRKFRSVHLISKALVKAETPSLVDLEMLMSDWIRGKVYSVTENGTFTTVEITVWVEDGVTFSRRQEFFMIPRPPPGNVSPISDCIGDWRRFTQSRKMMSQPEEIKILTVQEKSTDQLSNRRSWKVQFNMQENNFIKEFRQDQEKNSKLHFGVEIIVPEFSRRICGRLTEASPTEKNNGNVTATAFFQSHKQVNFQFELKHQAVFWMGRVVKEKLMELDDGKVFQVEETAYPGDKPDLTSQDERVIQDTVIPCPKFREMSMCDYLLSPSIPRVTHTPPQGLQVKYEGDYSEYTQHLNTAQKEAVSAMIRNPVHITEGPPGTGKSKTACYGVLALHSLQKKRRLSLCVAPTNYAADVFVDKLNEAQKDTAKHFTVMRMLTRSREEPVPPEKSSLFLHTALKSHPAYYRNKSMESIISKYEKSQRMILTESEENSLQEHFDNVRELVLNEVDVLVCTISVAIGGELMTYLKNRNDRLLSVVVDEANLVTVSLMLPLLALNPIKMWLLGDDKQLSPVTSSKSASTACAGISWMRLFTTTEYMKKIAPMTKLVEQYRMESMICSVVSYWMYEGRLKCAKEILNRKIEGYSKEFFDEFPMLRECSFFRITYDETTVKEQSRDPSFVNLKECDIIEGLVTKMRRLKVDMDKVAILVMYNAQLTELKKRIQGVDICTSDSFEGKEKSLIIVSMVRCNSRNNIGFMRDASRTLVAISRAINFLFFISAETTFRRSRIPCMEKLYEILDKKNIKRYRF